MKKEVSVFWFRRDLRLEDNTALYHALKSPYPVLPIFIFDPEILNELSEKKDKRVSYIYNTLKDLDSILKKNGSGIYIIYDTVKAAFDKILEQFDVKQVFTNHDYEPYAIARDLKVEKLLSAADISFNTFRDQVIFEKSDIMKSDGTPYTVFTPYSRRWKEKFRPELIEESDSLGNLDNLFKATTFPLPSLKEMGFEAVEPGVLALNLDKELVSNYHETRNLPGIEGTSHASVYLRFGTVSVRKLVKLAFKWNQQWLNELIWREFFMMILFHFPHVVNESFKSKYDKIPWRNNEKEFDQWCKGETGYPIVDAGMRQLNESGWMHNRVRMIVAGFLTKHLLIDWRWGEAYFAQKLLDYELSSNNGNWQWAAGSGCDSAPYFRIFNPTSQLKKFDPKLIYVKKWVENFNKYHIIPIVDHEFARKRALMVYKKALNES